MILPLTEIKSQGRQAGQPGHPVEQGEMNWNISKRKGEMIEHQVFVDEQLDPVRGVGDPIHSKAGHEHRQRSQVAHQKPAAPLRDYHHQQAQAEPPQHQQQQGLADD